MISRGKGILSRSERARIAISYANVALMLLAALAYLVPNEFVRSPGRPERYSGSLLVFIENLTRFPIWSTLFFSCAAVLFVCLVWNKPNIWKAHWYNCVVGFAYAASLWYGGFVAPGTYVVFACFASYVVFVNYSLAVSYAERPAE
ncbi:hypothetical protein SEA_GIBBLES_30 [Gordonia phage Gibbles]|uniref:Uncharacterized protein n=3 Tax=Gordonia phage Orchid TaxID=1838075 RepID=A0A160DHG8_9CAUD|nr:hypothetical protein BH761_gp031 [Gordonia phage Orchid]ANA87265.1 hypothetical protein PBI_PATRICKSTAR_31 [Gordonia phage PatrickStar]ANA87492.1 hypothetical protein PBI_KAMPE_31 [Gordonia phage Kampe]AXH46483.1 hypothetical protein SEA_ROBINSPARKLES_34 [Gordonia phage RobinSparkles]QDK01989.1 hypothetical protein SEA_GIBBLES_30 [Gordonia phage Gibbles]ANA87378.1 hypothetical protein PBI_ORCHID_31 [Gordonia phage Orchid]